MPIINVLHISDLHFQNWNEEQEDFISKFLNDIKGNNLKSLCKFIVFSDDLIQSPELINYEGVKKVYNITYENTSITHRSYWNIKLKRNRCQYFVNVCYLL